MTWATIVTISATAVLALVGYIATYLNNAETARRKDRIDRLNRQLSEFYGPLFAFVRVSNVAWDAFANTEAARGKSGLPFWYEDDPPTEEELALWRRWLREVFMPMNVRAVDLILTKADLIREDRMPPCLLLFCAHVSAYREVLKEWEEGNFERRTSVFDFPRDELLKYTAIAFRELKLEQQQLLSQLLPGKRVLPLPRMHDVQSDKASQAEIVEESKKELDELVLAANLPRARVYRELSTDPTPTGRDEIAPEP